MSHTQLPGSEAMRNADRWILWKSIPNEDPEKKPRKVPVYSSGRNRQGELDTPRDIANLSTYDEACRELKTGKYAGLGFALGPDGDGGCWQGIDFDNLSKNTDLKELVPDLPGYVENSPSKNGLHAIGYGEDFHSMGSNSTGIEAYSKGRYFTVTGDKVADNPLTCLADFIESRLRPIHSPPKKKKSSQEPRTFSGELNPDELRSALFYIPAEDRGTWQRMGHALKTLGEDGRDLFMAWSATSDKHDTSADSETWDSFQPNRTGFRAVFKEAIDRGWVTPYPRGESASEGTLQPAPFDIVTDMRVAALFAKQYQHKVRWWGEIKKWLVHDGKRWATDYPGNAFVFMKEQVGLMYEQARTLPDATRQNALKGILALEGHRRQETVLAAATVIPEMIVNSSQLDTNPMVLNVLNGTLDLTTGSLKPHNPDDFITRLISIDYNASAECQEFMKFLKRVLADDEELISYVQRFIGYCLTGKTIEQILLFLYGTGANGKTTLVSIIEKLLGDFASTADPSLLMQRDNRSASNDLAGLRGSRLVAVSEFSDGERLAESTIKNMTGGDRISCRFLYGEFFEYTPRYKILLIGNYKPKIRGRDNGIWRRIHLLPFNVTIPEAERDPNLMDKLNAELPGILSWAVQGCLKWQKTGLQPPAQVRKEIEAYRHSEDVFGLWLEECCQLGEFHQAPAGELISSFKEFSCWKNISTTKFGRMLGEHGFIKEKVGTVSWRGLKTNSGQLGHLSTFSVKSRGEDYKGSLHKILSTVPNCPESDPIPAPEIEWEDITDARS